MLTVIIENQIVSENGCTGVIFTTIRKGLDATLRFLNPFSSRGEFMLDLSVNNIFLPGHVPTKSATKYVKNDSFTLQQPGLKVYTFIDNVSFAENFVVLATGEFLNNSFIDGY